ncbi:MAG: ArsR family transcriptional regulator [Candidatus Woesearchaeota archaeon]
MDYNKLSFAIRSKNRKKVIMAMSSMKTPSQIKKEIGMEDSNVARALRELEREGIIKCLTPKQKMGRLYELTAEGEKIRKAIPK